MNSTCWEVLVSAPLEAQHPQSRVLELLHVALAAPWVVCCRTGCPDTVHLWNVVLRDSCPDKEKAGGMRRAHSAESRCPAE